MAGERKRVLIKLGDFEVPVRKAGATPGSFTIVKKVKPVWSKITQGVVTALDSPTTNFPTTLKGDSDDVIVAKGTRGAGSIKISLGETTPSGAEKLYSVPIPSYFSILDCYACIKNITSSTKLDNVKSFVSRYGVTYPYIKDNIPASEASSDEIKP